MLAGEERWSCVNSYFHFHDLSLFYDKPQKLHRIQIRDHAIERNLCKSIFKDLHSIFQHRTD